MNIYHDCIQLCCVQGRASYHDIKDSLVTIAGKSEIKNGIMTISSAHTTCSLYFDEAMHDKNYYGDEFLQVDINNIMQSIVPDMTSEGQYNSPGPKHIAFGLSLGNKDYPSEKWTMLNTDAHIRSSLYGTNSMTLIMKDGTLQLGALGRVYFVDWDRLRERKRNINVIVMGEK